MSWLTLVITHARSLAELAAACEQEPVDSQTLPALARRYVKTMAWLQEALKALDELPVQETK
jgi:hypothetical protein